MSECIWKVAAEDRRCRFCTWEGGCARRKARSRVSRQTYLSVMNDIVGRDICGSQNSWHISHYRFMVAYQMMRDGFSQYEIASLIGKNRTTVSYGISAIRDMLTLPQVYVEEAEVWGKYTKQINDMKNENVVKD